MAAKIITKGIGFLSVVYVLREHCINIISVSQNNNLKNFGWKLRGKKEGNEGIFNFISQ